MNLFIHTRQSIRYNSIKLIQYFHLIEIFTREEQFFSGISFNFVCIFFKQPLIYKKESLLLEGIIMVPEVTVNHREKAYALLKADADKILRLIEVQIENLTMPQCPVYEEVLDTQMFGLSKEIDFAVRLNLISENEGKALLENLEKKLNILHEASQNTL